MAPTWVKRGKPEAERAADDAQVRATVESVLADISARGDAAGRDLSVKFNRYDPPAFRLTASEIEAAIEKVAPATSRTSASHKLRITPGRVSTSTPVMLACWTAD